jgi:hypothetical protein
MPDLNNNKPAVIVVCLLLLVASVVAIFCFNRPSGGPSKDANKPLEALGAVLAEETANIMGGRGNVLVLTVARGNVKPGTPPKQPDTAFEKEMKKRAGIVVTKEYLETMELPAEQLIKLISRRPNADAVVSFVGLPVFTESDISSVHEKPVKMISVSWVKNGLREALEGKLIHLAIVPHTATATAKKPVTTRDWFNQYFEIYTPDKAASLTE